MGNVIIKKLIIAVCFICVFWYIASSDYSRGLILSMKNTVKHPLGPPIRQRPNVLFICVDDLGEDISPYNKLKDRNDPFYQKVSTPNLERLAADSLVLAQAYNQFPYCNPSRSSLLTGRRPDTTHVYDLKTNFREVGGNFTTIPQYFKENGYHTFGIGKVFHFHLFDVDPLSWSEPFSATEKDVFYVETLGAGPKPVTNQERLNHPIRDDVTIKSALEKMRTMSSSQVQPWFLAVGLGATHVPTVFPEQYLHQYPLENIAVPHNLYPPINAPLASARKNGKWAYKTGRSKLPEHRVEQGYLNSTTILLRWRQAYYSAVSYVDTSVGKLLEQLDRLDLTRTTIVVFWTDHGYIMGEHGIWGKNALFDRDLRCPMMIRIPGLTDGGVVVKQLTEYVDLFPTLVEGAGLMPIPQCPEFSTNTQTCHEGISMLPLIKDPLQKWKKAAFSQVILDL